MSTLASIFVAVPDDRPIDPLIRALFGQSVKGIEVLVAAPVDRDDAGRMAAVAGHQIPVKNLTLPAFAAGKTLNDAAQVAEGHYFVTLSGQAQIPDASWLFRLLDPFLDPHVAAVSGADLDVDRLSLQDPSYLLTLADFLCAPEFGASVKNTAFLRKLLLAHPFDERLLTCFDKEWTYRILREGYLLKMSYDVRVELPSPVDAEAALRTYWRDHQAIASFLRSTDRARFLWQWAWKRRDRGVLLEALKLNGRLRKHRFVDPTLRGALETRRRFRKADREMANP